MPYKQENETSPKIKDKLFYCEHLLTIVVLLLTDTYHHRVSVLLVIVSVTVLHADRLLSSTEYSTQYSSVLSTTEYASSSSSSQSLYSTLTSYTGRGRSRDSGRRSRHSRSFYNILNEISSICNIFQKRMSLVS